MINKKEQGKKNRKKGASFEKRVREDLEAEGWYVSKWQNKVTIHSVDPEDGIGGEMVACKPKFNPITRSLMMNSGGFPDFICIRKDPSGFNLVRFVESKLNGRLSAEEKQMAEWLTENVAPVFIAQDQDGKAMIKYTSFVKKEKGGKHGSN